MQDILKYTISACLDNLATVSNIFLPAGQVREYLFQLQKSLIQPSPQIPGQFSGEGWPELWAQELSLSQENLDKVLTIIASGRHVDFLYALYQKYVQKINPYCKSLLIINLVGVLVL